MTDLEIAEIEKRLKNASRAPWKSYIEGRDHESGSNFIMIGEEKNRQNDIELVGATIDDYDFIANARQDIPKLIEEIKRLRIIITQRQSS